MTAAAAIVAGIFLLGVVGIPARDTARASREGRREPYFHGGKAASAPPADASCQSARCHVAFPHRKGGGEAAFRNMHLRAADCLSCHGKDAERRWAGRAPGETGRKLRYAAPPGAADPHAWLGRAATCRNCHSEDGMRRFREKGVSALAPGFVDPIALRMIEGGAKRWVPGDLR